LAIVIRPPWWQTWWFITGLVLLSAGVIVYFLKKRIKIIRRDAALKLQFAELEIKGLHAQMNPHFIFNSLNSIKEMILEDQKQNASRYLSKFAQLIRTNLEQSRQAFVTVRQCIDHLEQYLQMEKLRFDAFSYSIKVEEGMRPDEINMAPMLVQPLVENAIWHGLRNKADNKQLLVRFFIKNRQLFCEIEDNGIGILQSKENKSGMHAAHRSLGITNIRERLAVLNEKYKMNCSLQIIDKSTLSEKNGTGTIVILQLTI
jgi:LytS/YehU family sensor histidine kinase